MNITLKEHVKEMMEEDPDTRDSYELAYFRLLKRLGFTLVFDIDELKDLPKIEAVTRVMREIQNTEGDLLPREGTRRKRTEAESEYKNYYKDINKRYPTVGKYLR